MIKHMLHLQREHLLKLKLDTSEDNKSKIQKVQQAIDTGKYGAKEYRWTRDKYSVEKFIEVWANPPFIPMKTKAVYLYLGHNYIFQLQGKTDKDMVYQWTDHDDKTHSYKTLSGAEKKMCEYIFDKTK